MEPSWQSWTGAAQRRKQRRLRSWWRHEQQSIAAALATYKHHSALRGQKTARAKEEDHEMHFTATFQAHPPPLAAGVQHFFLDDDEPPAAGSRPDRIATLSGQQKRDLRRTVEQIVAAVPLVPLLDDPVPQMVEQLPDVMRFFDLLLPVPEQVIEVSKILLDDVPMRTAVRDTQLVEQLVEVPTIISCSSLLQRTMEQNVDIPVPGRGRGIFDLQGSLPRQSSTALHGSLERTSERIVEQNVDLPVGGGLQDFLPGQSSSASSSSPAGVHGSADGPGQGFFSHFSPKRKKYEVGLALGVGTAHRVEPIHADSSCGRVVGGGASGQVPAAF